jgi:hypothetical protein
MESSGRDPAKQGRIMTELQSVIRKTGSKSYGNIESKIQSGRYRTNRQTLNRNRTALQTTKRSLTRKLNSGKSKQEKGTKGKIEKIDRLLAIMENETNVEEEYKNENSNTSNTNSNENAVGAPTPGVVLQGTNVVNAVHVVPEGLQEEVVEAVNVVPDLGLQESSVAALQVGPTILQEVRKVVSEEDLQQVLPEGNGVNNGTISAAPCRRRNTEILDALSVEDDAAEINEYTEESSLSSNTPPMKLAPSLTAVATKQTSEPSTLTDKDICTELFDPCTREPIASIEALEKRIRDIKKQRDIVPVGLYGLSNDTSNYDFLIKVFIDPNISLDDMVSFKLSEKRLPGTDMYEVLSRLFVFFGGIRDVNPRDGGNYKFMDRVEGGKIYKTSEEALKSMKCIASKGSGVSDITLVNVEDLTHESQNNGGPYCEIGCTPASNKGITKTYLMSVKWRKKEKNAENVDLEKLRIAQQELLTVEQTPADSIVFIKSKRDFQISNNRMYRQYVQHLAKTFFGWNEDVKPFLEGIRRGIFEIGNLKFNTSGEDKFKDALISQYFEPGAKPVLSLQLHQDIIVTGLCNTLKPTLETTNNKLYLIGVLPRGGKTFIAGGIIREYLTQTNIPNLNVFWLTAAPNETMIQVKEELLDKFQDFIDFEFIEVKAFADIKNKNKPHTVFFCSSQLLLASQKKDAKKREFLQSLLSSKDRLGLVFFDEAHKTGTGDKTMVEIQSIIQTYSHLNLPFIFLTATYYNILIDYQIEKSNTFIWDYTDVLMSRSLATETGQSDAVANLQTRFGKGLVDTVIQRRIANNETLETMAKAYIGFPDLFFISADFQEESIQRFTDQGMYRPDAGFSLSSIFAIKQGLTIADVKTAENRVRRDAYKIFDNLTNPKNIISLITPKEIFDVPAIIEIPGGEPLVKEKGEIIEPSLLGRINKLSSDEKSRFRLDEHPTLLMFMPTGGVGTNIFYLLCAWASLLMTHKWWRDNYEIACVVSEENVDTDAVGELLQRDLEGLDGIHIISNNPKTRIVALERDLHCQEIPKGLLILAGEKLSMGISLPCTDVVFLFNEKKSPDDIIQKMYRALTPSPGKKSAFVVDLNPVRTLAAVYGYIRASPKISNTPSNTTSEILDIIYDTYSWDSDVFDYSLTKGPDAKPLSFQEKLRQLFEKAEKDPNNEYRINEDIGGFEKKLGNNIKRGMNSEFTSKLAGQFSSKKLEATLGRIGLEEGSKVTLEKGKLIVKVPKKHVSGDSDESESPPDDDIVIIIDNFIETVSDFVKYLAITSTTPNLTDALEEYENNTLNQEGSSLQQNVLRLVRSRTEIKEGGDKTLLSKLLIAAVKDYALSSSVRVFNQMKGKIDERSIRKDKVLEIIHRRLTPRQKQKKDLGEVFTPINLIEDMLSHLPKSDWSNPDLKWLDPANGIGNFPVVLFYKLDEGLKAWESNENKRRKHIIENMIFMMEIQSNNNRIARNIFTSLCKSCTPNIWTIDTLKTTNEKINEHFQVDNFDRVIGNPPFQAFQEAGGKRGGGDELYMKFVKKSIELLKPDGFLIFVHPPSWRKPEFNEGRKKSKNAGMFDLMTHDNQMIYLEIHDSKDGLRVFKAGTRYDFYVLKKAPATTNTTIKDMHGQISDVDLRDFEFLPNFNIKNVLKLFPKKTEHICELGMFNEKTNTYDNSPCILYESSAYETRKAWVSQGETSQYKYPLVHATLKDGAKFFYSNTKDRGFFGIPKVIFGDGGINEPFIDMEGKYGMTQHAIGLVIKDKKDADKLKTFLQSNFFKNILSACMYSGFQIDWRLFTYFKRNFWDIDVKLDEHILQGSDDEPAQGGGAKQRRFTRKLKRT